MGYRFVRRVELLAAIDLSALREAGFRGIVLDLDNTVVSADDLLCSPGALEWIEEAKAQGFKLVLLSNSSCRDRVTAWSRRLGIPGVSRARKPLPFAFHKAVTALELTRHQTIVIGDSWHTDVLGARLVGCACIQVASLPHPKLWWEKFIGRWVYFPYVYTNTPVSLNSDER